MQDKREEQHEHDRGGAVMSVAAIPDTAGMFIGGEEVEAADGGRFETFDPSSGRPIVDVAEATAADVDSAVRAAADAFEVAWPATPPRERVQVLLRAAARLRERSDELIAVGERTAGLPTWFAAGDIENSARYFEYYAGVADKIHGSSIPLGGDFVDYTEREPWGVCALIPPFNVPFQIIARSLAPALATGNTVVIKPPEQDPLPALRLAEVLSEAGLAPGTLNVVPGSGPTVGAALCAHEEVRHITFTGSVGTGVAIMRAAAEGLKPVLLELGGKSPQVVFEDADLDAAVEAIVGTSLMTAGQVCSAGTRILAQRSVAADLRDRLVAAANGLRLGPAADGPDMGPLISRLQQERVLAAIQAARDEGAEALTGGAAPVGLDGYFVEPTLFAGVTPDMRIARDEVFGPVLALMEFDDEADAVRIANDSEFGLVAGVWTHDLGRAHRVARAIRTGQVFVNNYGAGGGVELPFGGYRKSGIGREKGLAAIDEYVQCKNVCVRIAR
jgi:aldehyde dehydrogenase (NAD+)